MFVRRALVATAALALLAGGAVATPAAAVDDGAALTLDAKLAKTLKAGGVKTSALKPATLSGKAFAFPAELDGSKVMLSGGMMMKSGKNVIKVTRMVVNGSVVDAEVYSKVTTQPQPMNFPITGLFRITGGTNQLAEAGTWTGAKLTLAKSVTVTGIKMDPAKLLGDALGVKLKSGAAFGVMDIAVTP